MSAIINGIVLGGAVLGIAIATAFVIGQRRLGKHRGVSREEFIRAFANSATPPEIPGTVYDFYKSRVLAKGFSVAPDDDYENALWEGEEDIDDDARFLMEKMGLKLPPEEVRAQWAEQTLRSRQRQLTLTTDSARWMQPIQTLRDMVMWLDWVRRHQSDVSLE